MTKEQKALEHNVEHIFSGNGSHIFKVNSVSGEIYDISIKLNCTCRYNSAEGLVKGKFCSHLLAAFMKILEMEKC